MTRYKVGILGATGMVGRRFISLLFNHPFFEITTLAASPRSAGKLFSEILTERGIEQTKEFKSVGTLEVLDINKDATEISKNVDFLFSCLEMEKKAIQDLEIAYASRGTPIISTNSAHRWTRDVPMIIPEVNPEQMKLIDIQQKKRKWKKGFIVVKPNCSIQSYVAVLTALQRFEPTRVHVTSMQAISGAGKTFADWPEMVDNLIPFISGEEEKSEKEPLKIWGKLTSKGLTIAKKPKISATCVRVAVSDGHTASIGVSFKHKPSKNEFIEAIENFSNPIASLKLPSSGKHPFIHYFENETRPQAKLDRDYNNGMGISVGRLRRGAFFDWQFVALSHNTIRGAAGGAVLTAELLAKKGYFDL